MKQKDVLIILISLLIFVVIWIGSNIYHNTIQSTISDVMNQEILPINPDFDIEIINKLKNREKINPSFEMENIEQEIASQEGQTAP